LESVVVVGSLSGKAREDEIKAMARRAEDWRKCMMSLRFVVWMIMPVYLS
jgi:hypothetical protein